MTNKRIKDEICCPSMEGSLIDDGEGGLLKDYMFSIECINEHPVSTMSLDDGFQFEHEVVAAAAKEIPPSQSLNACSKHSRASDLSPTRPSRRGSVDHSGPPVLVRQSIRRGRKKNSAVSNNNNQNCNNNNNKKVNTSSICSSISSTVDELNNCAAFPLTSLQRASSDGDRIPPRPSRRFSIDFEGVPAATTNTTTNTIAVRPARGVGGEDCIPQFPRRECSVDCEGFFALSYEDKAKLERTPWQQQVTAKADAAPSSPSSDDISPKCPTRIASYEHARFSIPFAKPINTNSRLSNCSSKLTDSSASLSAPSFYKAAPRREGTKSRENAFFGIIAKMQEIECPKQHQEKEKSSTTKSAATTTKPDTLNPRQCRSLSPRFNKAGSPRVALLTSKDLEELGLTATADDRSPDLSPKMPNRKGSISDLFPNKTVLRHHQTKVTSWAEKFREIKFFPDLCLNDDYSLNDIVTDLDHVDLDALSVMSQLPA